MRRLSKTQKSQILGEQNSRFHLNRLMRVISLNKCILTIIKSRSWVWPWNRECRRYRAQEIGNTICYELLWCIQKMQFIITWCNTTSNRIGFHIKNESNRNAICKKFSKMVIYFWCTENIETRCDKSWKIEEEEEIGLKKKVRMRKWIKPSDKEISHRREREKESKSQKMRIDWTRKRETER